MWCEALSSTLFRWRARRANFKFQRSFKSKFSALDVEINCSKHLLSSFLAGPDDKFLVSTVVWLRVLILEKMSARRPKSILKSNSLCIFDAEKCIRFEQQLKLVIYNVIFEFS